MAKLLGKIFSVTILMLTAASLVFGSFFYEKNFSSEVVLQKQNQLVLQNEGKQKTEVNRAGKKIILESGGLLQVGDIVDSDIKEDEVIYYGGEGVLRMADQTKVLISMVNTEKSIYSFKVLEGKVWLNNLFSNVNVNVVVDGAVIFPGQSVSYFEVKDGKAEIYANQGNVLVNLVSPDFAGNQVLEMNSEMYFNSLFLPQGTTATVYKSKIEENQKTISRLLFSKLIKEFNYGVFDKKKLTEESWLSKNLEQDAVLASNTRENRLKKIHQRGLQYLNYDAANYRLDQLVRDYSNILTFSEEKVGKRNMDALYDDLYDAQYLYDYGRTGEAKERLDQFNTRANQLIALYGNQLKNEFRTRVKKEYDYLSFVNPSDSLYQLRQVLEKFYLDSMKGEKEELSLRFMFLTDKLLALEYFAKVDDKKALSETFDSYMSVYKDLLKKYETELSKNIVLVQRQNQSLNNLFMQYADFYRVNFMTNKLYIENQYLSLMPVDQDKLEEIQTVIAQRIDFLRKLQVFFMDGLVPISDAQNIVALLFSEIAKIDLPEEYQVAVSGLFESRLEDYGLFSQFLNSPEYVDARVRGLTMKDRFESFKQHNKEQISIKTLREQLTGQTVVDAANSNKNITVNDGQNSGSIQVPVKSKVPRVKPVN